ncbi:hypothetical protein [Actinocorallia longicatena]|uniref:GlsB/YeaQ/YmgE family stress response membrane protein n=1 Tax=Actinocorallia longicatena TaxID=111803 RepID=A0ABP6QLX6_9ACTN
MTFVQFGALAFGMVIGWFTYFVNRYRQTVGLADVATIIGALGGGAILTLFPEESELFAAYGIGLALGFFGYFGLLLLLVRKTDGFTTAWFLDGRAPKLGDDERDGTGTNRAMRGTPADAPKPRVSRPPA